LSFARWFSISFNEQRGDVVRAVGRSTGLDRALVSRPSVMFADEPRSNLDSTNGGEILALLRDSVDSLGQTTAMVTHDAHAAAIADRVLFLADGNIVRDLGSSSAHEVLATLEEMAER
jgi:putative ABC transport system ATP-binding protein